MTSANRLQLAVVRETTLGVTPTTPRMRKMRLTGENLRYAPKFVNSDEIRSDRMMSDPVKIGEDNQGSINFELSYPVDQSPLSEFFSSALYNPWTRTPFRDNDGTADSSITDVNATGGVVTVTSAAAFVLGHLVRFTGFGENENNGLFRCTTGSATVPAFASQGLVAESAPAAAARMKTIGFQGASGDLSATSDGLASAALDFTTLGLQVGQWIKIGGTGASFRFATAALNVWARVTVIAVNALTLDNLPDDWTTDAGTGKTLRVFFGDVLRNGTTRGSLTIERGFLGQDTPTYIVQRGMTVSQIELRFDSERQITGSASFMGMTGAQSTTSLDATPDAESTAIAMAANVNVGRIAENGETVSAPNYTKSLNLSISNNLRQLMAVGQIGAVGLTEGECTVTGTMETYFGSNALFARLLNAAQTNVSVRSTKDGQTLVMTLPRVTYTDGAPSAGGKNQDVLLPLQFTAAKDPVTLCQIQFDRFDYAEE